MLNSDSKNNTNRFAPNTNYNILSGLTTDFSLGW